MNKLGTTDFIRVKEIENASYEDVLNYTNDYFDMTNLPSIEEALKYMAFYIDQINVLRNILYPKLYSWIKEHNDKNYKECNFVEIVSYNNKEITVNVTWKFDNGDKTYEIVTIPIKELK